MFRIFLNKIKESCLAVFPITALIYILLIFVVHATGETLLILGISAVLMIIGMSLFTMGADSAMIELGQGVGSTLSKSKKIWLIFACCLFIGFIITFAEPDLMVLAKQVEEFSNLSSVWVFISTVALGVGIFLLLASCKLLFKWKLSIILTISYAIIFILAFFVPAQFMPIGFDSGSVTTGPISVPFLISFGLGLSAVRSGKNEDDSFGLIALCSVGPIIAVMILSLFLSQGIETQVVEVAQNINVWQNMGQAILTYLKDVAITILPLVALFIIFQFSAFKYPKQKVIKMLLGFFITYIGIVLFLTGVECGYLNTGAMIGQYIFGLSKRWIGIPLGIGLGALSILAEPALHVLKKQVETITGGVLKQGLIVLVVSIGVALSVGFAVLQALYNFSLLYILLPVYAICIGLSFFNTKLFTAVAFDCGGIATGAMAVSFTLPFVTGLSTSASAGFGTVALIAAFPILSMQVLGFVYKLTLIKSNKPFSSFKTNKFSVLEFDWENKSIKKESFDEKE